MELNELLNGCKRGRTAAQKAIYDRFARSLFLLCRRYVKSDACAEEVLHNGFLKFFSSLDRFVYENDGATVAWMKKIMVNECLMHLRREHSFLQVSVDDATDIPVHEDPLDSLEATEIFMLILKLPTGYRTVFNLHVLEGVPHREIAALLGISEGTSKSQLNKARALLQQLLIQKKPEYALRQTK
jgi:RNA polymerase sigma factor (sigma-70 family)